MKFETVLKQGFNLDQFRIGQEAIISAILSKKDVLAVLPTGGGKSLCYQFPAIYSQQLVVVISPLIALMKDQVASLTKLGIPTGAFYSGQTDDEKRVIFSNIKKGGPFVLYLSPERAQKDGFKTWIKNQSLAMFAIDEAHCVSQWGHDFRDEYAQLKSLKELRPDVPMLALTASATPLVLNDISKNLKLNQPERLVHGFYRPNLYYQVEFCQADEEKDLILNESIRSTPEGRILIYCGTRKITESVSASLASLFKGVGFYHAGMSTAERTKTQESYARGELRILVATNAFGMGIDQPDVRLVVHYQMPSNIDALYQEMGRAGRDGKHSTCLMLYSKKDKGLQSFFIQNSPAPQEIKSSRWANLDALISYSEGGECRHSEILTYFKDSQKIIQCGHCDSCDPTSNRKIVKPKMTEALKTILKKGKKEKQTQDHSPLNPIQEKRFFSLKRWRKEKAAEMEVPSFVIFGDQTLRQLAIKNPSTLEALRSIYGIGETKLEKFGWDLLAELKSIE
jgi:ATP-dependent DNA helicase RecQ